MTDVQNSLHPSSAQSSLSIGQKAPMFVSILQNGEKFELEKALTSGAYVLLVFYPGDDTPGCTSQLCGIRDTYSEYSSLNVTVVGVNKAGSISHQKFIDKYSFPFHILVDEDNSVRDLYGATKLYFGNLTVKRGVFLISPNKTIIYRFWGQHDNSKVIQAIREHMNSIK